LLERLGPALGEVASALALVADFRDRPAGTLKINVPGSALRTVLPAIVPGFLAAYPEIKLELVADESFVDVLAAGCDAGIRYEERLAQDVIAVPIGPRVQRFATAAAPAYWDRHGRPGHPRDLLGHACLLGRFASGRLTAPWEYVRGDEIVRIDPKGPLIASVGGGTDLMIDVAIAGGGVISSFEDWLRPHFDSGALEPVLEEWWDSFSGPFLYYPGRRLVPPPLRAFIDYVKASAIGGA
jgi:DNA-binding transcriptional LysR family regulator